MFTGTLTNTGNVTLTNVIVVNSQPVPGTPILGPITLLPGAGTSFTGSYFVPLEACSMADTLTATGRDASNGATVTGNASATCAIVTTPAIAVSETCPPGSVTAGTVVAFNGLVSNTGNITLNNVLVFSSQPTNTTPLLGPITLAPGASAPFAGTYVALTGSGLITNQTVVTNITTTLTTNVSNVVVTNNNTVISTNAPTPYQLGTIDSVSKTVVDRFAVGTNFNGLTYAGEDHGYAATQLYSMRYDGTGTTFFDTITASTASFLVIPF